MNKKWKILYVLLVVGCLLCIGGMLWYLQADQQEEEIAEQKQEEIVEQFVSEEAQVELAELPIDFDGLQEINPEIYAWIRIPDTNIDYPILQHEGEDQGYYLTRDIYGENMPRYLIFGANIVDVNDIKVSTNIGECKLSISFLPRYL